jgi:hypothetical protein
MCEPVNALFVRMARVRFVHLHDEDNSGNTSNAQWEEPDEG